MSLIHHINFISPPHHHLSNRHTISDKQHPTLLFIQISFFLKSNWIANLLSNFGIGLTYHSLSKWNSADSPWLWNHNPLIVLLWIVHQILRKLSCFSRTGLPTNHSHHVLPYSLYDLLSVFVYWQMSRKWLLNLHDCCNILYQANCRKSKVN